MIKIKCRENAVMVVTWNSYDPNLFTVIIDSPSNQAHPLTHPLSRLTVHERHEFTKRGADNSFYSPIYSYIKCDTEVCSTWKFDYGQKQGVTRVPERQVDPAIYTPGGCVPAPILHLMIPLGFWDGMTWDLPEMETMRNSGPRM